MFCYYLFVCVLNSFEDGSFRVDCLPASNERRTVPVAANVVTACLQE